MLYTQSLLHYLEVLVLFCLLVLPGWDVFWQSPSMQVPSVVLHNKQLSVVLQFHTQSFLTVIPAIEQVKPFIHSLDTWTQHAALVSSASSPSKLIPFILMHMYALPVLF